MSAPENPTEHGFGDDVTGSDAGTVRDTRDHLGNPRTTGAPSDEGATEAAARELDRENEDEPTRSE